MTEVEAGDLVDFATTTGELYEAHKALAVKTTGDGSLKAHESWRLHIVGQVEPRYRREILHGGTMFVAPVERDKAAGSLRGYYERHIREA